MKPKAKWPGKKKVTAMCVELRVYGIAHQQRYAAEFMSRSTQMQKATYHWLAVHYNRLKGK